MGCGRGAIGSDAVHRPHQVQIAKVEQLDACGSQTVHRNVGLGQQVIGAGVVEEGPAVTRHGHHMGMGGQRGVGDDHAVGRQGGSRQGGGRPSSEPTYDDPAGFNAEDDIPF